MSSDAEQRLLDRLRQLRLGAFAVTYELYRREEPEHAGRLASLLARMVEAELAQRTERTVARRIEEARFVRVQTVDTFNFEYNASTRKLRKVFLQLIEADHVVQAVGAVFVGNSGLGKTHLARALGYAACQRGHRVLFLPCASLLNRLVAAEATKDLEQAVRKLVSPSLLIIDELAYATLSHVEANLFFQVISRRHDHHRPTVVTTNKPFTEWNQVFHGDATAQVIIDRLVERAEIFYLEGKSYRQTHRTGIESTRN